MPMRLMVMMIFVIAALGLLSAQDAPKSAADEARIAQYGTLEKWDNTPPARNFYTGKKSGPAPRRDLSGIWDSAVRLETPSSQTNQADGNYEHPAVLPGKGLANGSANGGRPDETGIIHPLPYTPLGLKALLANKPSGPGIRQVDAALSNDPFDKCDPMGFPQMELFQLRTIELAQLPNKVLYLNGFYGNWRIIWTDGRELPKEPDLRWNGYSVGHWIDDYTFVIETIGLNPRSWLDHAGRPHSENLRVEETWHRVDHDNMELTVKITDPKFYTEPWYGLKNFPMHLLPADYDIPELLCSPSEMADYNNQVGDVVLPSNKKK